MYTAIYVGGPHDGQRIVVGEPNHPPEHVDVIVPPPLDEFKAALDNGESWGSVVTMRYSLVGTLDIYDSVGIYTPSGEPLSLERTGEIIAEEGLRALTRTARSLRHEEVLREDCLRYAMHALDLTPVTPQAYAQMEYNRTREEYREWYALDLPPEPCIAPDEVFVSPDSMTLTFDGAYATAEEEMEEWRKILHGE